MKEQFPRINKCAARLLGTPEYVLYSMVSLVVEFLDRVYKISDIFA